MEKLNACRGVQGPEFMMSKRAVTFVLLADPQHLDFDCEIESFVSIAGRIREALLFIDQCTNIKCGSESSFDGNFHVAMIQTAQQVSWKRSHWGMLKLKYFCGWRCMFTSLYDWIRCHDRWSCRNFERCWSKLTCYGKKPCLRLKLCRHEKKRVSDEDMRTLKRLFGDF